MGIIIDTCIWVDVERGSLSPADVQKFTKNEPVYMSPVTIAELTFGVEMAKDESIRQHRIASIEKLKKKPILYIDEETGVVFGRLAAYFRSIRQDTKYRIQDLWIASQAVQHSYPILTHNIKDFKDIPGVVLIKI